MKSGLKRPTYSCRRSGVSRSGSTVTNKTWTCFASASSSFSKACLSSAIVVGQTSGQEVYPKKSSTTCPRISLSRKLVPLSRVNRISGACGYGSVYMVPRKPSGFEKRNAPAATAPSRRSENKPTESILLSMVLPELSRIQNHTPENRGDLLAAPIIPSTIHLFPNPKRYANLPIKYKAG